MINRYLAQTFISLVASIVILAFIFATFTWGPNIEAKLFPVLTEYTVTKEVRLSPNDLTLSGTFNKTRGECLPDRISGYLTNDNNTSAETVKIIFPNASNKYTVRPEGVQPFGPMLVSSEVGYNGKTLVLVAYHDCHNLWLSKSNLIEYKL